MAEQSGAASRASVFTITLDGVEYPVLVEGGAAPWKITVNGRLFTVEPAEESRVLVEGIAYQVGLEKDAVQVAEASYPLEVAGLSLGRTDQAPVPAAAPAAVKAGPGAIVAIMPGKITKIMVAEGQEVHVGDAVCVLEAMKMENELRSERDGVVKAIHVKPGDDVEEGQVLVEVEARAAGAA